MAPPSTVPSAQTWTWPGVCQQMLQRHAQQHRISARTQIGIDLNEDVAIRLASPQLVQDILCERAEVHILRPHLDVGDAKEGQQGVGVLVDTVHTLQNAVDIPAGTL